MSGSKYFDYNDHISNRVPKRRKVDLEFDRIVSIKETFSFFLTGRFVCCIGKEFFPQKQIDFFEAIAET